MATFSVKSNAYNSEPSKSALINDISTSNNRASLSMDEPIQVDLYAYTFLLQIPRGALVQTADEVADKPLAVFNLTSWQEVEQLEPQVAKDLKTPFTSIIASSEAFFTNLVCELLFVERRKKRVSVSSDVNFDEEEEPANEPKRPKGKMKAAKFGATETNSATTFQMPVVLPPVNVTGSNFIPNRTDRCLLYMDAVNIVVMKDEGGNRKFRNLVIDYTNATFLWEPSYVNCDVSNNTVGTAKLVPNTHKGYWKLVRVTMLSNLKISPPRTTQSEFMKEAVTLLGGTNTTATQYMDVESFYQYAYACSGTQAAFMPTDKPSYMVGIALNNIEVGLNHSPVDLKAYYGEKPQPFLAFNRDVNDCVGTFSVGSWMGIITSLVLASVLMFGYLMLQSIQTMDRFDDPKQKQIVINFKE
ncbi:unnamed protein product [Anisakis simplex]|uniref:V-type proton ATPase subunit S1/VOA1 transmembrane domain-containing protein n=1 Tax=Anisakis simplex TaxID=6269 RepID=A0A3P6T4S5_ANISI|nr:unnamed protein product [Anisakis simplex]